MEQQITGDGTLAFYARPGRYVVSFGGSPASGTVVTLRAGYSPSGADHVDLPNASGDPFQITGGNLPAPEEVALGGYCSLVTTSYAGSSGLVASFRRIASAD